MRPRRGRYGDSHIRPAALFDVNDPAAAPPAGSIDVQFRVPVSLSVMLDGMAQGGLDRESEAWGRGYSDLISRVLSKVQEAAGYAVEADGVAAPARLELAGIAETAVPGFDQTRWHAHVYIGPTAVTLASNERCPVSMDDVRRGVFGLVDPFYSLELEVLAERQLDVEWGEPQPGASREIVNPPWHEYVGANERGVCDGPWGRLGDLVLADERHLRLAAKPRSTDELGAGAGCVFGMR